MTERKARRMRVIWGAAVTVLLLVVYLSFNLFFDKTLSSLNLFRDLDTRIYDFRLRVMPHVPKDPRIVVVAIDDASLRQLGRWPWHREVLAQALEVVERGKPGAVGFDVIFSEPEQEIPPAVDRALRRWSQRRPGEVSPVMEEIRSTSGDVVLQRAVRKGGNVVLAAVLDTALETKDSPEVVDSKLACLQASAYGHVENVNRIDIFSPPYGEAADIPIASLSDVAAGIGFINIAPDPDGVVRRVPLGVLYVDALQTSFDVAMLRVAQKGKPGWGRLRLGEWASLGSSRVPLDENNQMLLPYRVAGDSASRGFKQVSFVEVLRGHVPPQTFTGKLVLVGVTAPGVYDLRVTPVSDNMPGIFIHAQMLHTLLTRDFIYRDRTLCLVADIAAIVIVGTMLTLLFALASAHVAYLSSGIIAVSYFLAVQVILQRRGLWLDTVYPIAEVILLSLVLGLHGYSTEGRDKRRLRSIFSSYVSPKIVSQVTLHPELASLHGDRREMTVLFGDLVGFSTFSENRQPEEIVKMLNEVFDQLADSVFEHDGTLDKFVGDEIMVFWGAPLPQANHAELAVRCALDMLERVRRLQTQWQTEGKPQVQIGFGINTGEMVVGNMGAAGRKMDYTVIGDNVNVAARVMGLTRTYHRPLVITRDTLDRITAGFLVEPLGSVQVKGRSEPVEVFGLSVTAEDHGAGEHGEESPRKNTFSEPMGTSGVV